MLKKPVIVGIILLFLFSIMIPIISSYEENTINKPSQSKLQVIGGWEKWFGGIGWDEGRSVQQTVDGGYILTGITQSFGSGLSNCYLIKTNKNGNKQWEKTFGGIGSDLGYSVLQTTDGGYIVAGTTDSFGVGHKDAWLIKIDSNGKIQWDKTFGGEEWDEQGFSVNQTADGGFIIAGYTSSFGAGYGDCYLIKTDINGNLQWEKTFGGIHWDYAYSVYQTTDGGYILAGDSITDNILPSTLDNKGTKMVWLIKTDSNGNKQWDKKFGEGLEQGGRSVKQTVDGGYIVCGFLQTGTSENSVWLIKTDSEGNKQWDKKYGGEDWDEGQSVQQTTDGGYIITGSTQSFGAGKCDVWVIKTDSNGNIQWDKTFGGGSYDAGYSVRQTSDGGYIVTGNTRSFGSGYWDVFLIKMDSGGNGHPNKPIINGPSPGKTSEACYYSVSEAEFIENETIVTTIGSLLFSEIELLDGDPSEIQQIERILNSIILQFITPYIEINVTDLEIIVTYEKKIPSILSRKFTYGTGLLDGENTTIYNGTHRVYIKGLDGQFFYVGGFPFLFMPRYFMLFGTYEEIVVENIGAIYCSTITRPVIN